MPCQPSTKSLGQIANRQHHCSGAGCGKLASRPNCRRTSRGKLASTVNPTPPTRPIRWGDTGPMHPSAGILRAPGAGTRPGLGEGCRLGSKCEQTRSCGGQLGNDLRGGRPQSRYRCLSECATRSLRTLSTTSKLSMPISELLDHELGRLCPSSFDTRYNITKQRL